MVIKLRKYKNKLCQYVSLLKLQHFYAMNIKWYTLNANAIINPFKDTELGPQNDRNIEKALSSHKNVLLSK